MLKISFFNGWNICSQTNNKARKKRTNIDSNLVLARVLHDGDELLDLE
jgi:hypothetical protein